MIITPSCSNTMISVISLIVSAAKKNMICGKADKYEYMDTISHGSYGTVYRAYDKRTGQIVALKEEFNGLSTSTLREIAILKSLPQHPAIVKIEVVRDDWDCVFIVMEHVENDLARFMAVRRQPLCPNEVKCMMKLLLEGVKFLHENGVMHRDLKPSNILINKKGELKICDFAISGAPLLTELGFDLMKKLLEYDPTKRITAEAALNHGWFKELDASSGLTQGNST
ncbi:UNVERIFIED_CONTAM: Cyclin-dependent kinase G-1 [Sesamum calycinum]|uniref:Cyclin-dependent kinase G-1 n=1 Tax=Sesamum calycinum TaxID=2727403 RepID=A0AAW2NGC1_9LAMI